MFGTTWVYESTFSALSFMKSKCRSIISENLASEVRCKYKIHTRFWIVQRKNVSSFVYINWMLKLYFILAWIRLLQLISPVSF